MSLVPKPLYIYTKQAIHISLPIGTNGKRLAAIVKFPNSIGKLMIGKILTTDGEEIANAMIGNDALVNYW